MSTSNRSSAAAATARAARSEASETKPANRRTPDRQRFSLTSPSRALDHRLNAARRDLADIDLAGRWFAPHYAIAEVQSCGLAGADILATAGGARISQLLGGESFAVLENSGDWAWGYSVHDHYVGYVRADALTRIAAPTHIVTAREALAFAAPTSRAAVRAVLPMGTRIGGQIEGDFLLTDAGFMPLQLVRPIDEETADPAAVAGRLNGTPYLWGGRGIGGIDCSGLVQLAFGLAGIALPRDSDQQVREGADVSGALRRGDLLFFRDHVVMLSAPDTAVHASGHWMQTVTEPLSDIIARLGAPVAQRRVLS